MSLSGKKEKKEKRKKKEDETINKNITFLPVKESRC